MYNTIMEYKPKYAEGEILVSFKHHYSEEFVRDFGKT